MIKLSFSSYFTKIFIRIKFHNLPPLPPPRHISIYFHLDLSIYNVVAYLNPTAMFIFSFHSFNSI